jgi:hypothetical protein
MQENHLKMYSTIKSVDVASSLCANFKDIGGFQAERGTIIGL